MSAATEHVQPTGAVAGYRPGRTLRLTVELRRQFKRRRTLGVLALMVALPLVLIGLTDDADTDRAIAVLEGLPGVTAELTDDGLVADLDGTSRARALQALIEAGIEVDQFTPRRRLEDAFLALVGESS